MIARPSLNTPLAGDFMRRPWLTAHPSSTHSGVADTSPSYVQCAKARQKNTFEHDRKAKSDFVSRPSGDDRLCFAVLIDRRVISQRDEISLSPTLANSYAKIE
jgi:hypothetical protein